MTVFSFISSVFYRLSYLIHAVQVCNIKATFQPSMNGMIMNKNSYSLTMKNNDDEKKPHCVLFSQLRCDLQQLLYRELLIVFRYKSEKFQG